MNAYDIVDRLHAVRSRGDGQWSARCPAHEDRGPSLSVKQLPDGRVLMHCFAGCGVDNVVGAIGLSLEDLFPPDVGYGHPPLAKRSLMSKGQALELLTSESMFVAVAAANVSKGLDLSTDDKDRLLKSAGRIALLQREASL